MYLPCDSVWLLHWLSASSVPASSCSDCRLSSAFQKAQRWKLLSKPTDFGFPLTCEGSSAQTESFSLRRLGRVFHIFSGESSAVQKIEVSQETFQGPRYASLKILILSMFFFTCCVWLPKAFHPPTRKNGKKPCHCLQTKQFFRSLTCQGLSESQTIVADLDTTEDSAKLK